MVYRVFVEKKEGLSNEALSLKSDVKSLLNVDIKSLRIINRYDVENIDEVSFERAVKTVFSEPQLDNVYRELKLSEGDAAFASEYLPGQFDQRADSAAQCIQVITEGERPLVRTAKIYVISGKIKDSDLDKIKKYVINPVESREASLDRFTTLKTDYQEPDMPKVLDGFNDLDDEGLLEFININGLAMDLEDLKFCRDYFKSENKTPTMTEIKVIDTYWSDHCRHTTFLTAIDSVKFLDPLARKAYDEFMAVRRELGRTKPVNLMEIATIGAKYLKSKGELNNLDESDEINACTVKIKVNVNGKEEDWLLLFKNETHNHPTEIEPFGGAATCIGGAIRDPLSGRAYVYAAMRITGSANPLALASDTIEGKLPQRKIAQTAAMGYSSYGNQIGLATGVVDEIYHEGYMAKHMEIGAVLAAAPSKNVRREEPEPYDNIILLGGRTGRDGCGGATGSSKSHTLKSLETCGAEVQKGNAPEERKLQRLFRNSEASKLIKRCNDFGAGGVSVAIGEIADGLEIDLDKVPKKYEGLSATELAISESQERMAVAVSPDDTEKFIKLADSENLEATAVAYVKDEKRLTMRYKGVKVVDISREFLNSNGAPKHIDIKVKSPKNYDKKPVSSFIDGYKALADDLNVCSKRGLSERFDSTIGAGTVLAPFGGKNQLTPIQAMVHKIPLLEGETDDCSFMSWGYNPFITEKDPFKGAYLAVLESISKLIASGASFKNIYLTFQEYFPKPEKDPERWGLPLSALLGAFKAQMDYSCAAIGGKDSMSGTFENIDVPPTLVSFAVTTGKTYDVVSPEFKKPWHKVVLLKCESKNGLPDPEQEKELFDVVNSLIKKGYVEACSAVGYGGIAECVMKMAFGNSIGFEFNEEIEISELFSYNYGAFVLELNTEEETGTLLGHTRDEKTIKYGEREITIKELLSIYENKLEPVYPCNIKNNEKDIPIFNYNSEKRQKSSFKIAKPRVLIPVFPGTNCEYDSEKAVIRAGGVPETFVINNLTPLGVSESASAFSEKIKNSNIIFIPGGFSGGDEPEGSGKFITSFFRNGKIKDAVNELLKNRDGLILGICNGFQALIKLGLVPYGEIIDADENCPVLTYNTIGRHQSRIVRTRIASNKSPWLMNTAPGEIYSVPISHGEGRFIASEELINKLSENGQIATQYVDFDGKPTCDIRFNPNNSDCAIEGITSPDGRVLGKMGHCERYGKDLYKNVDGDFDIPLFSSAAEYFS